MKTTSVSPPALFVCLLLALLTQDARGQPEQRNPGKRDHLAFVYSGPESRIILYGGSGEVDGRYSWNADTWTWDGESWQETEDASPGRIASMSAVAVAHNETLLMVGGINPDKGDLSETWIRTNRKWQLHEGPGPKARLSPAMAYDPGRETVVLFSGCAGRNYPADTWEWNGSAWLERLAPGPGRGLCRAALFYDQVRKKVVLFGGVTSGDVRLNEMWEWDGTRWARVDPGEIVPPPRSNSLIAYDEGRRRAVLFGGNGEKGVLGDLWEWDGARWHEIRQPAEAGPGPRELYGLAYHPGLKSVLLYGGRQVFARPLADLWRWNGTQWLRVH